MALEGLVKPFARPRRERRAADIAGPVLAPAQVFAVRIGQNTGEAGSSTLFKATEVCAPVDIGDGRFDQ
jgi:hypothetical protein